MTGDTLRELWNRMRSLFRRDGLDRDRDAEMAAHIQMATEDNLRAGMSPSEARRRALVSFGGLQQARELQADARGLPFLDALWQDARYAVRTLRRDAAFTAVALLILGLAIGANATVFSVVNTILLRPLPFPSARNLVWIAPPPQKCGLSCATYSADAYEEFAARTTSYDGVTGYQAFTGSDNLRLMRDGDSTAITGIEVVSNFLDVLGVKPLLGRGFTAREARTGAHPVAMLEYFYWRRAFNADPAIVGRELNLNGQLVTVVGVLPESFDFATVFAPGERVDLLVPLNLDDERMNGNIVTLIGRLKSGVSLGRAQAEATAVVPTLCWNEKTPRSCGAYAGPSGGMRLRTLKDYVSGRLRRPLIALWSAVGMILLIACVNLSSLLLARAAAREKEVAMRAALGASRARLLRQMLTESLMLSLTGAALGLALAWGLVAWLARQASVALPLLSTLRIDPAALLWTALIAVLAAMLFGVIPGLRAAGANLQDALKDSGHGSTAGRRHARSRSILVVLEVALACVLLVGAGLLLRSFLRVLEIDLGFQPQRAASITLDFPEYNDTSLKTDVSVARRGQLFRAAQERVGALPGVEAVGIVDHLPLGANRAWGSPQPEGKTYPDGTLPSPLVYVCTPGYFKAMGIHIRGRDFAWGDLPNHPMVVLINAAAARFYWPDEDAIGKVLLTGGHVKLQVIGVVDDVHASSIEDEKSWQIYYSATQYFPAGAEMVIRGHFDPATLGPAVLRTLRELTPNQPTAALIPIGSIVDQALSPRRFFLLLVGLFAALGLGLAALGIYGVIAYDVTRRTEEIGIRMALGASSGRVQRAVLSRVLRLVAIGLGAGTVAALAMSSAIQSLLFGTEPTDPVTYAGVALLLLLTATLAGYLPARRAAHIDPIIALRAG